jgi:hypothetical protein
VSSNAVRVFICCLLSTCAVTLSAQTSATPAPAAPADTSAPAAAAPGAQTQQTPPAATPAPAPAAAPAAPPAETWSIGPIDFSGLIDGYYSYNFDHPADRVNQLYNFNTESQQFSLNMAEFKLSHSPDPVGFELDFGFGRAYDIIHANEQAPDIFRYIEQAYVSFKPAKAKGLEIDFGDFVTSAGAEVIETNQNWNYSRSLLFAYAIPYYHFGLRTSMPLGKYFTAGVQVVNGWNNIEDNNSGKTIGLTETLTVKKFSWSNNYYTGPENNNTNRGWRNLYDTTLLLTPNGNFNAYINVDYGQNVNKLIDPNTQKWYGIAGAAHFQVSKTISFSPRVEWFKDAQGFSTGTPQTLKEFTLTGEYKWSQGILSRLEYRRDFSNVPFFEEGPIPMIAKNQDTVTLGIVGYFGPKR